MPAWFAIARATLPYVAEIAAAAIPVFTSRRKAEKSTEAASELIGELQTAVTDNWEKIHTLALQLQTTIEGLDTLVTAQQAELARLRKVQRRTTWIAVLTLLLTLGVIVFK